MFLFSGRGDLKALFTANCEERLSECGSEALRKNDSCSLLRLISAKADRSSPCIILYLYYYNVSNTTNFTDLMRLLIENIWCFMTVIPRITYTKQYKNGDVTRPLPLFFLPQPLRCLSWQKPFLASCISSSSPSSSSPSPSTSNLPADPPQPINSPSHVENWE